MLTSPPTPLRRRGEPEPIIGKLKIPTAFSPDGAGSPEAKRRATGESGYDNRKNAPAITAPYIGVVMYWV